MNGFRRFACNTYFEDSGGRLCKISPATLAPEFAGINVPDDQALFPSTTPCRTEAANPLLELFSQALGTHKYVN